MTTKEESMEDDSIKEEEASRENAVGEFPTEFLRADPSLGMKDWNDLDCERWITLSLSYFHILPSTLSNFPHLPHPLFHIFHQACWNFSQFL